VGLHLEEELKSNLHFQDENQADIDRAVARISRWENKGNTESPAAIAKEMKTVMQNSFGVFRDAGPMQDGLKKLQTLSERLEHAKLTDTSKVFNLARVEALELDNLMATAINTAYSAMQRTESRGAHCRYDYRERDDQQWLKHTICYEDGSLGYRPVNFAPVGMEPFPLAARD